MKESRYTEAVAQFTYEKKHTTYCTRIILNTHTSALYTAQKIKNHFSIKYPLFFNARILNRESFTRDSLADSFQEFQSRYKLTLPVKKHNVCGSNSINALGIEPNCFNYWVFNYSWVEKCNSRTNKLLSESRSNQLTYIQQLDRLTHIVVTTYLCFSTIFPFCFLCMNTRNRCENHENISVQLDMWMYVHLLTISLSLFLLFCTCVGDDVGDMPTRSKMSTLMHKIHGHNIVIHLIHIVIHYNIIGAVISMSPQIKETK